MACGGGEGVGVGASAAGLPTGFHARLQWLLNARQCPPGELAAALGVDAAQIHQWSAQASPTAPGKGYAGLPILGLQDLPAHRRPLATRKATSPTSPNAVLLHHLAQTLPTALTPGQKAAWTSLATCPVTSQEPPPAKPARQGNDGLFHLKTMPGFACAEHHHIVSPGPHGRKLPSQIQAELPRVRLTGFTLWPAAVQDELRCTRDDEYWEPHEPLVSHAPGRLRSIMDDIREGLGLACGCCGQAVGTVVDHDHGTGQVRGALCLPCNRDVDTCTHQSGCAYADYLNTPPVTWQVRHPGQL